MPHPSQSSKQNDHRSGGSRTAESHRKIQSKIDRSDERKRSDKTKGAHDNGTHAGWRAVLSCPAITTPAEAR